MGSSVDLPSTPIPPSYTSVPPPEACVADGAGGGSFWDIEDDSSVANSSGSGEGVVGNFANFDAAGAMGDAPAPASAGGVDGFADFDGAVFGNAAAGDAAPAPEPIYSRQLTF